AFAVAVLRRVEQAGALRAIAIASRPAARPDVTQPSVAGEPAAAGVGAPRRAAAATTGIKGALALIVAAEHAAEAVHQQRTANHARGGRRGGAKERAAGRHG